mgnify:CR=1 FL=1
MDSVHTARAEESIQKEEMVEILEEEKKEKAKGKEKEKEDEKEKGKESVLVAGPLLRPDGTLAQEGYSTQLVRSYNREHIAHGWHRIKEWDYYAVLCDEYGVTFTVAELGLMSLCAVVYLDFTKKRYITGEQTFLLTRGTTNLPPTSAEGHVRLGAPEQEEGDPSSTFIAFERLPSSRRIRCQMPSFGSLPGGFACDLTLQQPLEMDTMTIATSWAECRTAFYYNQKVNCMAATGSARVGEHTLQFGVDDNDNGAGEQKDESASLPHILEAYGVLDWGRGVWTYQNRWFWGSMSGKMVSDDGVPHTVGFNIGYGFSDRTPASENMIFFDGKGHKLRQVEWYIPSKKQRKKQEADPSSPSRGVLAHTATCDELAFTEGTWYFTSGDGRFEMEFAPCLDRFSDTNLFIFRSIQHQVFGRFSGHIVLDDGERIEIKNMIGFAEDVFNRW